MLLSGMSGLLSVFLCMLLGLQRSLADTVAVGEPVVFMCGGASERQQCILPGKSKKLHPIVLLLSRTPRLSNPTVTSQ